MENGAGIGTGVEAIYATVAALAALDAEDAALASAGASGTAGDGIDVMQRAYEIRLERMGLEKKLESQAAARKARSATEAMDLQHAMTPPDAPLHDRTYTEISTVEEIAGILTISSGAASAFVIQSRQVCAMPPLMDALSAGSLSWQQARIFTDETEALDHADAAALVAHFLDPHAPNPARGCPASEMVPARLRAKVRGWRERHHPESIEQRHRKGVADRRVEFTPDRDGMAWIAAYLPADQALAIFNDLTATARSLQGPSEPRTLSQLRPDILTHRLLTNRGAIATDPTGTGCVPGEAPQDMIGLATLVGSDQPATDLGISDDPGGRGNLAPAEPDPAAPGTFENTPNPAPDTEAAKVPTPAPTCL